LSQNPEEASVDDMLLSNNDDPLENLNTNNKKESYPLFDNDEDKYFAMKERQLDLDLLSQVSSEST